MKLQPLERKVLDILTQRGTVHTKTFIHDYGITRAAARVQTLRQKGFDIETIDIPGDPFCSYRLNGTPTPKQAGRIEIVDGKALFLTH